MQVNEPCCGRQRQLASFHLQTPGLPGMALQGTFFQFVYSGTVFYVPAQASLRAEELPQLDSAAAKLIRWRLAAMPPTRTSVNLSQRVV